MLSRPKLVAFVVGLALISAISSLSPALADEVNPGVYSVDAEPFGITHGEWTAKWWQWFVGIPTSQTPAEDATGERCAIGQTDPDVYFLTGTFEGNAERDCAIPHGSAILVPIIAGACSVVEYPELKTEPELRECAVTTNAPDDLGASVDGVELEEIWSYGVESPLFNLTYPEDNISGVESGDSPAVSHFYSLFLEPLPVGEHDITFHQLTLDDPASGVAGFAYSVTYHIDVVERNFETISEPLSVGNVNSTLSVNSSSTITDIRLDEGQKAISFVASEISPQGRAEINVGSALNGPYTVMVSDNPVAYRDGGDDGFPESSTIKFAYPPGTHEVTIIGTSVVPEFGQLTLAVLLVFVSSLVLLARFTSRWKNWNMTV